MDQVVSRDRTRHHRRLRIGYHQGADRAARRHAAIFRPVDGGEDVAEEICEHLGIDVDYGLVHTANITNLCQSTAQYGPNAQKK